MEVKNSSTRVPRCLIGPHWWRWNPNGVGSWHQPLWRHAEPKKVGLYICGRGYASLVAYHCKPPQRERERERDRTDNEEVRADMRVTSQVAKPSIADQ